MKKVFRFQYEPCAGTCYAHEELFTTELRRIPLENLESMVSKIVAAHDSICDDSSQRFGVDYCEVNNIFVGSFINGTRLDLFSNKNFFNLINTLSEHVLSENKNKKKSFGDCIYGLNGNENLAEIILKLVA